MRGPAVTRSIREMSDAALIEIAFRRGSVFRQKYAEHVAAWDALTRREIWARYYRQPGFRAAYDSRVACEGRAA